LSKALHELDFTQSDADHGVFVRKAKDSLVALAVHVDDCMVTGFPTPVIQKFKTDINKRYKMTDLGSCNWLLGI